MTRIHRISFYLAAGLLLGACAVPVLPERDPSPGHLKPQTATLPETIPEPVGQVPILPPPRPAPLLETYTVVVNDVPVRDLLFALARDAKVNVDISPGLTGNVTINAIDQTLPQILERLSEQLDLRYTMQGNLVTVGPDAPYLQTYKLDYLNMARDSQTSIRVSSQVASSVGGSQGGGGGSSGGANSSTTITNTSANRLWETVIQNILNILGEGGGAGGAGKGSSSSSVIANPETGVITVRANARQHRAINEFLTQSQSSAHRQVLIEATIVAVELSDQYEAGINWEALRTGSAGFSAGQSLATAVGSSALTLTYTSADFTGAIKLLGKYGNARVLSSPKLMVLNNQTSVLKVTRDLVYFEVQATNTHATTIQSAMQAVQTNIKTVAEGIVMNVTPQISENDSVILNVRPSISRKVGEVSDPNPTLKYNSVTGAALPNAIPNLVPIMETRELESVLRVNSGQTAVLGGLMTDDVSRQQEGVPFLKDIPLLGNLFQYRSDRNKKSELVVFIRPTVVRDASIETDLQELHPYLEQTVRPDLGLPATLGGEKIHESVTGRP